MSALPTCHEHVEAVPAWYPTDGGMERAVVFEPGYICPVQTGHGHGRHGMNIRWLLRGPKGAAQLLIYTGWMPGQMHMTRSLADLHPMAADLGYHARVPQYEDQWSPGDCEYLGTPCYYDGSSLAADSVFLAFTKAGESAIWSALAERYDGIRDQL